MPTSGGGIYTAQGIVSQLVDLDYFTFTALGGATTIQVNVDEYVNDLNARVRVFDSTGALIATDDPFLPFDANLTLTLTAGAVYHVEVSSHGSAGEAGQYELDIGPVGTD